MSLYPLRLTLDAGDERVAIVVDPLGWRFASEADTLTFSELPPAERLKLRRDAAAQVALAKDTPKTGCAR